MTDDGYLMHIVANKRLYVDQNYRLHFEFAQDIQPARIISTTNTVPLNEWIQVAVTVDSTNQDMHMYVADLNNHWEEVGLYTAGTGSVTVDVATNSYFLNDSSALSPFPGSMAEIGIWNRVLTATELENLGIKRYTPSLVTSGLRGAWRLNGGNPEVDSSRFGNNATLEPSNTELTVTDSPPLILTEAPAGASTVTVYAPNLTSPMGGETFNRGIVEITWDIKNPPTSHSSLTLDNVTYELEYTENYVGRETIWTTIRRRISGSSTSYDWPVGKMLKSSTVRMRVRAFCESINRTSEWSPSDSDFTVNVFKLTPPVILSPVSDKNYADFISIILEEDQVVNTYNQKVRYKIEYQSEDADVSWTTLYEDLPVGSSPLRWNIDNLSTANDYQLKLTVSDNDNDQHTATYVRNIKITNPGLFYIDTQPPTGVIQFENKDQVTNILDQTLNLYVEDEVTDVKNMALRERNLTSQVAGGNTASPIMTLGPIEDETKMFDPVQIESDCVEFKDESGTAISPMDFTPKINWSLMKNRTDDKRSGLIKVEAKLADYGGNDSCLKKVHLFMPVWEATETLTDMIIVKETREFLVPQDNANIPFTTISRTVNTAYISTISGRMYRVEPYPVLVYELDYKISKLATLSSNIYIFAYQSTTDVSYVYRDDKTTDPKLITSFTDALSEITAVSLYDGYLFIGMQNGQLWRFNGTSFSQITDFDNAITTLYGDDRYLYIGFYGGTQTTLYNGTSLINLLIEV